MSTVINVLFYVFVLACLLSLAWPVLWAIFLPRRLWKYFRRQRGPKIASDIARLLSTKQ